MGSSEWAEFRAILSDEATATRFRHYLEKSYSVENLSFWLSVKKYRKLKENRAEAYARITRRYFDPTSPRQISADYDELCRIFDVDADNPPSHIFNRVQAEIEETLVNVCVPGFRKSDYYYPQEETSPTRKRDKILRRKTPTGVTYFTRLHREAASSPDSQTDSIELMREYVLSHLDHPFRCSLDSSEDDPLLSHPIC